MLSLPLGIWENRWVDKVLGAVVNAFRALPFIILLVALIPLSRLIALVSLVQPVADRVARFFDHR